MSSARCQASKAPWRHAHNSGARRSAAAASSIGIPPTSSAAIKLRRRPRLVYDGVAARKPFARRRWNPRRRGIGIISRGSNQTAPELRISKSNEAQRAVKFVFTKAEAGGSFSLWKYRRASCMREPAHNKAFMTGVRAVSYQTN